MWNWWVRTWHIKLQPLVNWVPAGIQSLFYNDYKGKLILRNLRGSSPDFYTMISKMKALNFRWLRDRPFDYVQKPWVTCDRAGGDCDDFAHLWKALLQGYGKTELLLTKSKKGDMHMMCIFTAAGSSWLLSNVNLLDKESEADKDKFKTKFYGSETLWSVIYDG